MTLVSAVTAAFLLGLLGAGHCLAMCGGIVSALSASGEHVPFGRLLAYNAGRIGGYALIGALSAAVVTLLPDSGWPVARSVAGVILILMGLHMAGWWNAILTLERLGGRLWQTIKPLTQRCLPVKTFWQAALVGFIWGWLPCGLVYSALAYSAAQAEPVTGALTMLAFGLGTWPAMLSSGWLLARLRKHLRSGRWRIPMGVGFIVFGLWTLWLPWQHMGHHGHQAVDSAEDLGDSPEMEHIHHH